MDLKSFRKKHRLTGSDIVDTLHSEFPKYSKSTNSMIENPEYGVKLDERAENLLKAAFEEKSCTQCIHHAACMMWSGGEISQGTATMCPNFHA